MRLLEGVGLNRCERTALCGHRKASGALSTIDAQKEAAQMAQDGPIAIGTLDDVAVARQVGEVIEKGVFD